MVNLKNSVIVFIYLSPLQKSGFIAFSSIPRIRYFAIKQLNSENVYKKNPSILPEVYPRDLFLNSLTPL